MDNLTLGQQLKNAREALNLSIQEVASQTQLKAAHIDALENDIFILPSVAPAFVRGYVRNYVRFLRLPEELIGTVNYGEVSIPAMPKKPAISPNRRSQGRLLKGLTILVLLIAFGMTLLWWWQEHQKEQQNRDALVNTQMTTSETTDSANNSATSNEVTLAVQPSVNENAPLPATESANNAVAVVQTNPEVAPELVAQPEASAQAGQNSVEIANQPVAVETPAVQTAPEAVNVLTMPSAEPQTANSENPTTDTAAINEELRIEITGSASWITVRGAKGKRLAEKLYNAGEVLSFNDNEQYRLTIGAPANVKIYYKGQAVPLKVDGRVARIRLPLAK